MDNKPTFDMIEVLDYYKEHPEVLEYLLAILNGDKDGQ